MLRTTGIALCQESLLFGCIVRHCHGLVSCITISFMCQIDDDCASAGVVGGIVIALLLALCLCFFCRRKRNKQVGEKRVAAKKEKQQKQKRQPSGPLLGFLRRRKKGGGGAGTSMELTLMGRYAFCFVLFSPALFCFVLLHLLLSLSECCTAWNCCEHK